MKCICGHECENLWEDGVRDRFVRLNVMFLTPEQRGLYRYEVESEQNALYMCPKCGTVRAERD